MADEVPKSTGVAVRRPAAPSTMTTTATTPVVATAHGPLILPTRKSVPVTSLEDLIIIISGNEKIGKTGLTSMFPENLSLMWEPGGKLLEMYQMDMTRWVDYLKTLQLLRNTDRFKNVTLDTIDACYERCSDHVCQQLDIKHPSQLEWGAGWNAVAKEFRQGMRTAAGLGRGFIGLSHVKREEYSDRGVKKYRIVTTMPNKAKEWANATADILATYVYHGDERWLHISGSEEVEAGNRCERNFLTPEGEKVRAIPMGGSKEEAYANFMKAFRNEQEDVGTPTKTASDELVALPTPRAGVR